MVSRVAVTLDTTRPGGIGGPAGKWFGWYRRSGWQSGHVRETVAR